MDIKNPDPPVKRGRRRNADKMMVQLNINIELSQALLERFMKHIAESNESPGMLIKRLIEEEIGIA